jgi:hypothetical protein
MAYPECPDCVCDCGGQAEPTEEETQVPEVTVDPWAKCRVDGVMWYKVTDESQWPKFVDGRRVCYVQPHTYGTFMQFDHFNDNGAVVPKDTNLHYRDLVMVGGVATQQLFQVFADGNDYHKHQTCRDIQADGGNNLYLATGCNLSWRDNNWLGSVDVQLYVESKNVDVIYVP